MQHLKISNFKCFNDVTIPINQLTIMAGANGNGKSTAIQALLFLRKTIEENYKLNGNNDKYLLSGNIETSMALNTGYLLSLGNSSYITNRLSDTNQISLSIYDTTVGLDSEIKINYIADDTETQLFLTAKYSPKGYINSPLIKKEFYYLNAERIGPRVSQAIQFYNFPNAGFQGENVAQMIDDLNYTLTIDEKRRHPQKNKTPRLEAQINAWLDELMPGVNISAKRSIETLTAQIQVENFYTKGSPTIAPNIGFGISYVLPIIATGLIAQKDSYMIVENPEAHLHPSAQSKIGRFLAMVADAGVHVIVETHSDHVLNGIQIACAKNEIAHNKVTVNFFSQENSNTQPNIENITINSKGELSKWPRGFFDQTQIDFAELFKIRKR